MPTSTDTLQQEKNTIVENCLSTCNTFQIKTNSLSSPRNKIKGHNFAKRQESILAKQPVESGKLNSCQPDDYYQCLD